jgi:hypothetical protein
VCVRVQDKDRKRMINGFTRAKLFVIIFGTVPSWRYHSLAVHGGVEIRFVLESESRNIHINT